MNLLNQLCFVAYRTIRRIGTADIRCVFGIGISELRTTILDEQLRFLEITKSAIYDLIIAYPDSFDESQASQLADGNVFGFAILDGHALAAYAWLATGDLHAGFNHNGDLRAGLPVYLPPDTGFIYNVFVTPSYRGRRLYGSIMSELAKRIRSRGVTRLILTTDAMNENSLKAVRRMGFRDLGRAWLFRVGPFSMARYPPSPVFGSARFGKYAGDLRAVRTAE
jgi:ribosomal protein S18 acetylase RimI-like enzyme